LYTKGVGVIKASEEKRESEKHVPKRRKGPQKVRGGKSITGSFESIACPTKTHWHTVRREKVSYKKRAWGRKRT